MKLRELLLAGCCAAIATLGVAASAHADTTTDLLKSLRAKGVLSKTEYETLLKNKKAEDAVEAEREKTQTAAAAQNTDSFVKIADKGVGFKVGQVNVAISGSINGFYVHDSGDSKAGNIAGGLVNTGRTSSVRNGLLPGFIKFDITTQQDGWDVGAHFGIYPGIDSVSWGNGANSAGSPQALSTSGADFRQTYLTLGRAGIGELKIGRDIGLFGQDAILNDMTLLGVGTAAGNSAPSNTSLGRIGLGYIYTDFQPQISFTSAKFSGFSIGAGIFQPLTTIGKSEVNSSPGFQGRLAYDFATSGLTGHLWLSGIVQKHDAGGGTLKDYTGEAFDIGAKFGYGPVGLLGYYYKGKGVGTTGLFINSVSAAGNRRDSDGFYVQGTVNPIEKLTLGVSYGESNLDRATGEATSALVKKNSSWVGQVKYQVTPWVSPIVEFTNSKAQAHNGAKADSNAIAVGAILLF